MRFPAILFFLLAIHGCVVYARLSRRSYTTSRREPASHLNRHATKSSTLSSSRSLSLRQHHEPRQILDVCAYIDTDALLGANILGIPLNLLGDLKICLCLSALPVALEADVQLKLLVAILGKNELSALLTTLINTIAGGHHCTYPEHAQPACDPADPCGFTCDCPYVREGNQCVCQAPNIICNGQCGPFPEGCSSAVPRSLKARSNSKTLSSVNPHGAIITLAEARETCAEHETVCGIHGGSSEGFDCVDVQHDLESCGGCIVPSPFEVTYNGMQGRDCTAIQGAERVSCSLGRCAVQKCADEWAVNEQGDGCIQLLGEASKWTEDEPVTSEVLATPGTEPDYNRSSRRILRTA